MDDVDKRLDSVADLAAVHAWLPEIGVDQKRAALYGGSYGGYMVLAGLTFQPELVGRGRGYRRHLVPGHVPAQHLAVPPGLPGEGVRPARHRSRDVGGGVTDQPHRRRRAPVFVIHGANDPRVPLTEAEQLVDAVRSRGTRVRAAVYGDEGHGLAKRANRLDAYPKASRLPTADTSPRGRRRHVDGAREEIDQGRPERVVGKVVLTSSADRGEPDAAAVRRAVDQSPSCPRRPSRATTPW